MQIAEANIVLKLVINTFKNDKNYYFSLPFFFFFIFSLITNIFFFVSPKRARSSKTASKSKTQKQENGNVLNGEPEVESKAKSTELKLNG